MDTSPPERGDLEVDLQLLTTQVVMIAVLHHVLSIIEIRNVNIREQYNPFVFRQVCFISYF